MINYIGTSMNGQNQKESIRYSGLNVFRAIINTVHKEELYPVVKDSLGMISQILIDNNYPNYFKALCIYIKINNEKFRRRINQWYYIF